MKNFLIAFVSVCLLFTGIVSVQAQDTLPVLTVEQLKQYDGKDGHKSYFAFEGKIYDVTGSTLWKLGEHYGLQAGNDLTDKLAKAPHGTEVFVGKFPVVGTLAGSQAPTTAVTSTNTTQTQPSQQPQTKAWYEGRIRIFGISILGWTGIILGILFVLNFGSCFALPWHNTSLPKIFERFKSAEGNPKYTNWGSFHKYMAWSTLIVGIIHGVLGLMQLFGYYL